MANKYDTTRTVYVKITASQRGQSAGQFVDRHANLALAVGALTLCIVIFTGSIAHSAKRRYLTYLEGDFEFFSPRRGDTLHRRGKIWHGGPLNHAKFHPPRCNNKGIGPPKLKILLKFYQTSEYKRSLARFS